MQKISGINYLILAAFAGLMLVSWVGSGKGRGKNVPVDERHAPTYQSIREGRSRAESELICQTCHGKSSIPLPKAHPQKEECLLCHLLQIKRDPD